MISPVAAPWPAGLGIVLPGGFTVFNNKLYILGGFDTVTNGGQATNQIWELLQSGWLGAEELCPASPARIHTHDDHRLLHLHRWRQRYHGWRSYRYDTPLDMTRSGIP